MAQTSDTPGGASIDRSERPGRMGLLLFLAALLVGAAVSLSFVTPDRAQPLILLLLALLGMAGVFFLFAYAIGAVRFSGADARNDLTKAIADGAPEGLVVAEDDGRILYANESYLALAGGESFAIMVRPAACAGPTKIPRPSANPQKAACDSAKSSGMPNPISPIRHPRIVRFGPIQSSIQANPKAPAADAAFRAIANMTICWNVMPNVPAA